MIKKRNDGIVFDSTVYLSEENHRKFPLHMRLLQALIIYAGGYCFVNIFIQCFDLKIIDSHLIWAIIVIGSAFYLMLLYPIYDFIKLISVLTIYGGVLYYKYGQLKNGFFILENAIIKRASAYYDFPGFQFIADYSEAERDVTVLLIIIIIPIIGLFTLSLIRGKLKFICYIIMSIPVIASFAMGITPPEFNLILFILIMLFLSISNGFSLAEPSSKNGGIHKSVIYRIGIRSASIFCLLSFLLFIIIKQFLPLERYNKYDGVIETKTKLQNVMMDLSFQDVSDRFANVNWSIGPSRFESSGGLALGELGRVDQVVYDEAGHLQITAPLGSVLEGIYLKGYIGSVYTRDRWKTHSRDMVDSYKDVLADISIEEFEPAIGNSMLINQSLLNSYVSQGRIGVTYLEANKNYLYAPYFTLFKEEDRVKFEYDLGAIPDKRMEIRDFDYSYNITKLSHRLINDLIRDNSSLEIPLQFFKNEEIYREFVYDIYTRLPEKGLDRIKHDFSKEQVGVDSENLQDAINYIKNYLNRSMRYTLSPGRLPKDKDFVEYFVYENKIGYCTHFASAGALMLRAMGYPARYVEGYAIDSSDLMDPASLYMGRENGIVEITVKDYNAHAWVEVYYDTLGWIPVEFTTGSGMDDFVDSVGNVEGVEQEMVEEEPVDTPPEESPNPTAIPEEEVKLAPQDLGQDDKINGSGLLEDNEEIPSTSFRWTVVLIPIIILSIGLNLYLLFSSKSREGDVNESYSRRALRLYRKVERLFILDNGLLKGRQSLEDYEEYIKVNISLIPVEDFEIFMDTVRKAKFGRETISQGEYMIVSNFYNILWHKVYNRLPGIKRLYIKITMK